VFIVLLKLFVGRRAKRPTYQTAISVRYRGPLQLLPSVSQLQLARHKIPVFFAPSVLLHSYPQCGCFLACVVRYSSARRTRMNLVDLIPVVVLGVAYLLLFTAAH
jgi:hypothetical protein